MQKRKKIKTTVTLGVSLHGDTISIEIQDENSRKHIVRLEMPSSQFGKLVTGRTVSGVRTFITGGNENDKN